MDFKTDLDADFFRIREGALDDIDGSGNQRADAGEAEDGCAFQVALHHFHLLAEAQGTVVINVVLKETVIAGRCQVVFLHPFLPLSLKFLCINGVRELLDHRLSQKLHAGSACLGCFAQAAFEIQCAHII